MFSVTFKVQEGIKLTECIVLILNRAELTTCQTGLLVTANIKSGKHFTNLSIYTFRHLHYIYTQESQ